MHGTSLKRLALVLLALSVGTACKQSAPEEPKGCAACASARLENGWCEGCEVGYVAAYPIKSKMFFEVLDAHGHELQLDQIRCRTCRAAIKSDGFCEHCRMGWVGKKAYFSRLTFELAQGTRTRKTEINCPMCRKNAENHGWCNHCQTGMIGNVALSRREGFEAGCTAYDRMVVACRETDRCESCGIAMLMDSACFFCKTEYKDGKLVSKAKP